MVEASASTSDPWGGFTAQTRSLSLQGERGTTFFKVQSLGVLQVQLVQRSFAGQWQEDGAGLCLVLTVTSEGTLYKPHGVSGSLPSCLEAERGAGLTCDDPVQ